MPLLQRHFHLQFSPQFLLFSSSFFLFTGCFRIISTHVISVSFPFYRVVFSYLFYLRNILPGGGVSRGYIVLGRNILSGVDSLRGHKDRIALFLI